MKDSRSPTLRLSNPRVDGAVDAARQRISDMHNPSLQGTGHLVDRTLQGVVGTPNKKGEA